MANSRSTFMANLLAKPMVINSAQLSHGRVRAKITEIVLDNTEAPGHLVPLWRVKKNDKIIKVEIANLAIAAATDVNVGLWTAVDWTLADGVVADADIFLDGVSLAVAHIAYFDYAGGLAAGVGMRTPAQLDRLVWEDAGAASFAAAAAEFDIVMQFVADPAAAATIAAMLIYTAGD